MNFSNFPFCAPRTFFISAVNLYFSTCFLRIIFSSLVAMCFVQREVSSLTFIIFIDDQYRGAIGLFNSFKFASCRIVTLLPILFLVILLVLKLSLSNLLLMSGSVHPNPGPNNINFSIAHLNVRSLNVNDKVSEISVLACLHGFDVFCIF